ncbi:hypothetical protein [Arthrobacter sp. EpRS71]|uniref:hypothetical protein n=1 Tax=Arthrobacter sp. EpRS71 TaxID=1743141 RepID=UPI0007487A07|nr:hypothetical protein [Arthrobacter sp. EpRS71]KUM39017.1 hypothetical protein AR689_07635 [Arthrobacter sp. EpRS71]
MSNDYEDNVQRIVRLMQDTFGDTFKTYYDGDPEAIPVFNLPCVIVTQKSDETTADSWQQDEVEDQITIKIVLNKRDDFDNDKVNPLNMTERKIRDFVGERDPETGFYLPRTVKGAVRTMATKGITAIAGTMNVEYGITPRVPGEGLADLTAEGHVTFPISFAVDIPVPAEEDN